MLRSVLELSSSPSVFHRAMSTIKGAADEVKQRIIWIDCEMTGLDFQKQTLCEIAVIVTDSDLNTVAMGPDIVIHQPAEVLEKMEEWPRKVFLKNGLMEKIKASTVSLEDAEKQVIDFLKLHTKKGTAPIAGNSIHVDRCFLRKYMPKLDDYAHYRCIDVSTIKGLAQRWYPEYIHPRKQNTHRALDDILESIEELKDYRKKLFRESVASS